MIYYSRITLTYPGEFQ